MTTLVWYSQENKLYLIQAQWGYISTASAPTTITLPIAFSSAVYSIVANTKWTSGDLFALATNLSSLTQILVYGHKNAASQPAYWICIGKQQWGRVNLSKDTKATVSFPISYTNSCYMVSGSFLCDAHDNWTMFLASVTNSNFVVYPYGGAYSSWLWITLGIQQWGTISLAQDGSANATLPLAITTFISGWGSDTAANREYTSGIYVTANNTTSVKVAHIGYSKTARWFVISK